MSLVSPDQQTVLGMCILGIWGYFAKNWIIKEIFAQWMFNWLYDSIEIKGIRKKLSHMGSQMFSLDEDQILENQACEIDKKFIKDFENL